MQSGPPGGPPPGSFPTLHMHMPGGSLFGNVSRYYRSHLGPGAFGNPHNNNNQFGDYLLMSILNGYATAAGGGGTSYEHLSHMDDLQRRWRRHVRSDRNRTMTLWDDLVYSVENGHAFDPFNRMLNEVVVTGRKVDLEEEEIPVIWEEYQHETAIPGWSYTAQRLTPYGEIWAAEQRAMDWALFRRFTPLGKAISIAQGIMEMAKDKTDHLKGGKQNQRDSDIKQYPTEFQRWYHREYKSPGDPNATKAELQELYKEWNRMGQPRAK